MEKSIITTGKTLDLAIEAALKQLNLDRDSVSVEIIENAKSGFLGIGAVPAKVKVTYEAPDEETAPKPALSSASRSKPKKAAAPIDTVVVPQPKPAAPMPPKPQDTVERRSDRKPERRSNDRRSDRKPERRGDRPDRRTDRPERAERRTAPVEPKEYAPAAPGSTEEKIELFLKGLLQHMGSDAVPHAFKTGEDTYGVDLVGADLGVLIGRRGDTLDAIQHLTNYAVNRDAAKRVRVSVDAENYRKKREESLQRLAVKVAGKVVRYRRNITLEPMNAYERHVIHAALQDTAFITTYSTGTEPNRRIVVAYTRDKASAPEAPASEEA